MVHRNRILVLLALISIIIYDGHKIKLGVECQEGGSPVNGAGALGNVDLLKEYNEKYGGAADRRVDLIDDAQLSGKYEVEVKKGNWTMAGNEREIILVNGIPSGPPIFMKKNSIISINVTNRMEEDTSLHCHGIHFVDNYAWYDGASMVTECSVPRNGGEQRYIIKPGKDQVGTFFCHSHSNGQYLDGFRFPLIIEDSEELKRLKLDEKSGRYVANVYDWYFEDYDTLFAEFLNPHNPEGVEPTPDAPIVNGYVRDRENIIDCSKSEQVLLYVVNSSGIAQFFITVDGEHPMTVVEVDGVLVEESEQEVVVISAAQRISFLIKCNAVDKSYDYKVRFIYDLGMFDQPPDGDMEANMYISYSTNGSKENPIFKGNLVVDSDDEDRLKLYTEQNEIFAEKTDDLVYTPRVPLDGVVTDNEDEIIHLSVDFIVLDDFCNHGTFNDIAFYHPEVPSIYSMLTLDKDTYGVASAYGTYTNTHVIPYGRDVTIVLQNLDAGDHPFHLHGYTFQVFKNVPISSTEGELENLNTKNPPRTDTLVVKSQYYAVIGFKANNPGAWMFHCHVQWHLDAGLGMIFVVLPPNDSSKNTSYPHDVYSHPPYQMYSNCRLLNKKIEGNAVGLRGVDLTGEVVRPTKLPKLFIRFSGYVGIILDAIAFVGGVYFISRSTVKAQSIYYPPTP